MHDIICPHCGNAYIANDVAFDLSEYIIPLISNSLEENDDVKNLGFKFYASEEIIRQGISENPEKLHCSDNGGDGTWCRFSINRSMLYKYIQIRSDISEREFNGYVNRIRNKDFNLRTENDTAFLEFLYKKFYKQFFTISNKSEQMSIRDTGFVSAVGIFRTICENIDRTITLNIRIFVNKDDHERNIVPHYLIINDAGRQTHIKKCCPFCGIKLPQEFGRYKSCPVVLLGSHFSGKTSYLLSLLHTIENKPPFTSEDGLFTVQTLNDDPDLVAFRKNINNFLEGKAPLKTDFVSIPVLNLLVSNKDTKIIYEFIDWPGEKFISDNNDDVISFITQKRPVIMRARHFLCFLDPTQIDSTIENEAQENASYRPAELIQQFRYHVEQSNKTKSVICVLNKLDKIVRNDNQDEQVPQLLRDVMSQYSEISVYDNNAWNEEGFEAIQNAATGYLTNTRASYIGGFRAMRNGSVYFIPVAPYGHYVDSETENRIHDTKLSGLPLLCILKTDKIINEEEKEDN